MHDLPRSFVLVPTLFCVAAKLSQSDSLALESLAEEIKNSSNISAPALSSIGRRFEFVCGRRVNGSSQAKNLYSSQGRSQNLKEVPQNFTEVLTLMMSQLIISYRETNIAKKKIDLSPMVIADVKLA